MPAATPAPSSWGALLRRLIDRDRYPALTEIVASGVLDCPAS